MNKSLPSLLFLAVLAAAGLFVIQSSRTLPEMVASHFGPSGAANGFMSRSFYLWFMVGFVVVLPLALNLLIGHVLKLPSTRINIPHREYWLAPERRGATVVRLRRHMQFFGGLLAVFLCYVHWQVVQANTRTPAALDNTRFSMGLAIFMASLIVWIVILRRDFRPPQP